MSVQHHTGQTSPRPTRWHVITGAPCSGKTSVVKTLEHNGHRVVHEVARAHIDDLLAGGASLDRIKADPLAFERHILNAKIAIEQRLPRDQLIFMDRAVPDSIAYFRLEGLATDEPRRQSRRVRYQRIFLFEQLGFEKDGVRTEDRAMAERIERLLIHAYEGLGYDIIRVPRLSIQERVTFVLSCIDKS